MRTRMIVVPAALTLMSGFALILAAQLGAFQPEEARIIPLNTVFATFTQEGMKSADEAANDEGLFQAMSAIRETPPQIVLCRGKDVVAAVKSSATSFSLPPEPVAAMTVVKNDSLWVAAYLGSDGSIPPAYRIRAIEVKGTTIRVAYERDESPGRSCDLRDYLMWAPVGPVTPGTYTLELFDAGADMVIRTRPWQVIVK